MTIEQVTLFLRADTFDGANVKIEAMKNNRWRVVSSYVNAYRNYYVGGVLQGSHATEIVVFFERHTEHGSEEKRTPTAEMTQEGGPYPRASRFANPAPGDVERLDPTRHPSVHG